MNRSLINIGAIVVGCFALLSCGGKKKGNPANAPTPVNLMVVHYSPAVYYDEYPGTVVALSQVDIHPEVEGYVTGIFFKEGDHVEKGQKLYEIDKSKYQANYDQAIANVKVAEANLDEAQKDADRYIYLNKHDAIAKQILDHALTTLQNAKNQVTSAKQDLVKAQTDLNYATIRAPFSGTIGISQVKLGNTVTIGQTTLNTISTDDPMAVDFVINEKQLSRFLKLQRQRVNPSDSLFTIVMPDNTLYAYTGQISVIDRGVDPQTGTVIIRLTFPNPQTDLRAGMSCTVRVHNEDTSQQIIIPNKAVVEQMGEYFIFLAKDTIIHSPTDTANTKQAKEAEDQPALHAIQRKVVLGQQIDENVIVKTGMKDGDTLIVDGIQKLKTGSVVTTANTASPQQQGSTGGKGGSKSQ
jgi:membrane fusion protein, multidrug efflux system